MKNKKIIFELPKKGILKQNSDHDALKFYYYPFVGQLYINRVQQAVSLLKKKYTTGLELGYGSGVLLPSLSKICEELYGLDLDSDPKEVNDNLKKLGIHSKLFKGDAAKTRFASNKFDLIVAISIFEHIKDIGMVVKEAYRILKPGGELLVGMPRVDKVMELIFPLIGVNDIVGRHVTTHRKFLKAAKKQGFELVKLKKLPQFLPEPFCLYFNMLLRKPNK